MSEPIDAAAAVRHRHSLGHWPSYNPGDMLAADVVVIGPRGAPGALVMPADPLSTWRRHWAAVRRAERAAAHAERIAAEREAHAVKVAAAAAERAQGEARLPELRAEAERLLAELPALARAVHAGRPPAEEV
jgi:hypothetical protein